MDGQYRIRVARIGTALICGLVGLICVLAVSSINSANAQKPLLQDKKKTLFQKVLTKPGATVVSAPAKGAGVVEGKIAPFNLFYVFERKNADGVDWIRVGRSIDKPPTGWMLAAKGIDWKQSIVVAFNNPAGRGRSLLFKSKKGLLDVLNSEDLIARAKSLREKAVAGKLPPDSPVVSIEPETFIDINKQFYLLPIMEHQRRRLPGRLTGKVLKVASVPLDVNPLSDTKSRDDVLRDFNVGIVFVIDTTTSMGPFIDRTRKAVESLYQRIAKSDISERVSFGLVGFRDNTKLAPGLGYVTKTFQPLDRKSDPDAIIKALQTMKPSKTSSKGFNEDSLAAIHSAVTTTDWKQFGGKYIVLVTDAGPRDWKEATAGVKNLGPKELNTLAQENGIAVFALHLMTPQGSFDHPYAESAYRRLSKFGDQELYYGVENGGVEAFGKTVDDLADALIKQVEGAIKGKLAETKSKKSKGPKADVGLVGLAMQLAYLGKREGTKAPDVFEGWVLEKDLTDLRKTSLDVRVFLSKNQLATMRDVAKAIIEKAEKSTLDFNPDAFFDQLRSAVAAMMRSRPDRVVNAEFETLGDALGEYLSGLPYKSDITSLTKRDWVTMTGGAQRELIDNLRGKVRLFERVHDTPGLWTALYKGSPEGEKVYAIPLDAMP